MPVIFASKLVKALSLLLLLEAAAVALCYALDALQPAFTDLWCDVEDALLRVGVDIS